MRTSRPSRDMAGVGKASVEKTERFSKGGWHVVTTTSSISSSAEMDSLSEKVGFPLPEMVFGANRVTLSHEGGLCISFTPQGALTACPPSTKIKLAVADEKAWKSQRKGMSPALSQWKAKPGKSEGILSTGAAAAGAAAAAAATRAGGIAEETTARRSPLDYDWTCEWDRKEAKAYIGQMTRQTQRPLSASSQLDLCRGAHAWWRGEGGDAFGDREEVGHGAAQAQGPNSLLQGGHPLRKSSRTRELPRECSCFELFALTTVGCTLALWSSGLGLDRKMSS